MCYNILCYGGVAHLGERDIRIVEVTGSSPAVSTIQKVLKLCGFRAFSFYAKIWDFKNFVFSSDAYSFCVIYRIPLKATFSRDFFGKSATFSRDFLKFRYFSANKKSARRRKQNYTNEMTLELLHLSPTVKQGSFLFSFNIEHYFNLSFFLFHRASRCLQSVFFGSLLALL